MKIVFLKDVPRVGRRGEVKEVADGYARNFLLARGLAKEATAGAIRKIEEEEKQSLEQHDKEKILFLEECGALKEKGVVIKGKANKNGVLFAGVTETGLKRKITDLGFKTVAAHVKLSEPIKNVGSHRVEVEYGGITKTLEVEIVSF